MKMPNAEDLPWLQRRQDFRTRQRLAQRGVLGARGKGKRAAGGRHRRFIAKQRHHIGGDDLSAAISLTRRAHGGR